MYAQTHLDGMVSYTCYWMRALLKNADSQFDPEPLSSPDIDGEAFGCSWYGHGSNCLQYGFNRDTENFGLIASEACCSCGGGCSDVEGW